MWEAPKYGDLSAMIGSGDRPDRHSVVGRLLRRRPLFCLPLRASRLALASNSELLAPS
jgi:hypothetical protein